MKREWSQDKEPEDRLSLSPIAGADKGPRTAKAQLEEPHLSQAASPKVLDTEALPGQTNRSVEWSRTEATQSTGIKTPESWFGALRESHCFDEWGLTCSPHRRTILTLPHTTHRTNPKKTAVQLHPWGCL